MPRTPQQIGPYEILEELGRGGMGVVFKARHRELGRVVALKTIASDGANGESAEARFKREAEAAARLASHPNIVGVHDVGRDGETLWFAMELVTGADSLDQAIEDGELTPDAIARLGVTVARALAHAHAEGILHRDIKPANIMLDERGQPLITDFGLAKRTVADPELTRLTQSGDLLGTPAYMAPEQAKGEPVDARADIYALGATLYHALAGHPPFDGDSVTSTLVRALREPAPPLRSVASWTPPRLASIVEQCLEKRAEDRYPSAADLADDLERFVRGESVLARRPSRVARAGRWAGAHPLALGAAVLTVLAAGIAIGVWAAGRSRTADASASAAQAASATDLADQATRLSAAHAGLTQQSAAGMQALEQHFFRERRGPDPRPAAHAAIAAAVDAAAKRDPDLGLPLAWSALARFYGGDEAGGLDDFERARAAAPGDPFPPLLMAQAYLARYAREAELPFVTYGPGGVSFSPFQESEAMALDRQRAQALLQPLIGAPVWSQLRQGTTAAAFAAGAVALAEGRYAEVDGALAPLADDPLLGASVNALRGLALYLDRRFEPAAAAFAAQGARGWAYSLRRASVAMTSAAAVVRADGGDPTPLLERAIGLYERCVAIAPKDTSSRIGLGVAHAHLGDAAERAGGAPVPHWERAIAVYTRVLKVRRDHPVALSNRGRTHRAIAEWHRTRRKPFMQRLAQAEADLARAVALNPRYATARSNYANCLKAIARGHRDAGRRPEAVQYYRRAIAEYDAALQLNPDRLSTHGSRGSAWRELAAELVRMGKDVRGELREAIAALTARLDGAPGDAGSAFQRGLARQMLGEEQIRHGEDPTAALTAAVADFDTAIAGRAFLALAHEERGNTRRELGLWQRRTKTPCEAVLRAAVADLQQAVNLAPDDKGIRNSLGSTRQTLALELRDRGGDPAPVLRAAIADFTWIAERHPRWSTAWNNRGLVRWNLANVTGQDRAEFAAAAADFAQAARLGRGRAWYWHGKCQERLGRVPEAMAAYEAELKRNPKDPDAQARLAALRKQG